MVVLQDEMTPLNVKQGFITLYVIKDEVRYDCCHICGNRRGYLAALYLMKTSEWDVKAEVHLPPISSHNINQKQ